MYHIGRTTPAVPLVCVPSFLLRDISDFLSVGSQSGMRAAEPRGKIILVTESPTECTEAYRDPDTIPHSGVTATAGPHHHLGASGTPPHSALPFTDDVVDHLLHRLAARIDRGPSGDFEAPPVYRT